MGRMLSYEETMVAGAAEYVDVIAALEQRGLPTVFTQTGGMCAALEVQLETGHTLLVTDAEDTLPWRRSELRGWGVGMYEPGDDAAFPVSFASEQETSVEALFRLVERVMFQRPGTSTLLADRQ